MDLTIVKNGPVDEVGVRTSRGCWNQASCNFRSNHIFLDWLEPGNHRLIISFQSGTFSKHKTCQKNHDNNITMCDITAEIVLLLLFLCVFWDWWSLWTIFLKNPRKMVVETVSNFDICFKQKYIFYIFFDLLIAFFFDPPSTSKVID